jgi:signal peptidase
MHIRNNKPQRVDALVRQVLMIVPPWALVGGWALAVYLWVNVAHAALLSPELSVYLVQPLLWLSLGAVSLFGWRVALVERPRPTPRLVLTGALVGAFHVALLVLAGLAFGFGSSPYGHSFLVLLGNAIYTGSMLLSVEMARAFLVVGMGRRPTLAIVSASLLFTLINVPLARWAGVSDLGTFGRLAGEILLPGFPRTPHFPPGVLGSCPLMYRGVLHAFEWLSPVLPRLPWAATAFVGTLGPVLGLILTHRTFQVRGSGERRSLGLALPILGLAAVALLWFNVGLFGVQPTVVSGVSMEPAMKAGDLAIVREVPAAEIEVGDVVRFRHEGVHVVHRVVETETDGGSSLQGTGRRPGSPLSEDRSGVVVLVAPKWVGGHLRAS